MVQYSDTEVFGKKKISTIFHNLDKEYNLNKEVTELKNKEERKIVFHLFMKYLFDRYIYSNESKEVHFFEKMIKGCICDIEFRQTQIQRKEIYLYINLHNSDLNQNNINTEKCNIYDNILGNKLNDLINGRYTSRLVSSEKIREGSTKAKKPEEKRNNILSNNNNNNNNKPSATDINNISVTLIKYMENPGEYKRLEKIKSKMRNNEAYYDIKSTKSSEESNFIKFYETELEDILKAKVKTNFSNIFFNTGIENLVDNIVNTKLLPKSEKKKEELSQKFANVLRLWNKLYNNKSRDIKQTEDALKILSEIDVELQSIINDYVREGVLFRAELNEKAYQKENSQYKQRVYSFYKNFFDVIIRPTLTFPFGLEVKQKRDSQDMESKKRGGKKSKKNKNKVKHPFKRFTRKKNKK